MRSREGSTPKGSITNRLFFIFIAFALVPVLALSIIAILYVDDTAREQIDRVLSGETDTFSDLVAGRLAFGARGLELFAAQVDVESDIGALQWRQEGSQADGDLDMGLAPASFTRDRLTSAQLEHLARGRAALLEGESSWRGDESYLLLALDVNNLNAGFAVGRLTTDYMLGPPDTRNLTNDNCLVSGTGAILFSSNLSLCSAFSSDALGHRGKLRKTVSEIDYYMTHRSLFLREAYATEDWQALVIAPDADVLRASEVFRSTLLGFAILSLLVLSLLSIRLIRRQMRPLDRVMEGIARVTQQDYAHTVSVKSGDEFEALANAFNRMSGQVSLQLTTLRSMAEIDQLILSRGKKEDILRIVLEKTRLVLPGDHIAIAMPEEQASEELKLYALGENGLLDASPLTMSVAAQEAIRTNNNHIIDTHGASVPAYLRPLFDERYRYQQVLPVVIEDRLVAVGVIGFIDKSEQDLESLETASRYADRIAVALSNAEWEERLFYQANYDALTDLPNRPALIDELRKRILRAQRERGSFGVLFIDLDNFKLVNDSLGHETGDRVLAAIATRLSACLRENDVVSRLGGDEFIILSDYTASHRATVASMNRISQRILESVQEPLMIDGSEFRTNASIGIAICPEDGSDATDLMKHADMAMYHAKSEGPGRFQFYSAELNAQAVELMQLSTELKRALERNEFLLHYQPKVRAENGEIVGAEALIRWQHPKRGLLWPGNFIEAAESLGLINAIGEWALGEACRQLGAWRREKLEVVPVSINVSASQIHHEGLLQQLDRHTAAEQVLAEDLEFEITERVLVDNVEENIATLRAIRERGVAISIDDYGTGYSSLSYMKNLPADKLKIDGSFIADIADNSADQAIVSSIITLSRRLSMTVVAEGVETAAQLELLKAYGCDEIQGYLFSHPLDAGSFAALLRLGECITPGQDQV